MPTTAPITTPRTATVAADAAALRVDFISDITCPWCAIGLATLEQAIAQLANEVRVALHLQPFELNPGMPFEGMPIAHFAARKYGASAAQLAERQALIRSRAAELGLRFRERTHVYDTFDAHRGCTGQPRSEGSST